MGRLYLPRKKTVWSRPGQICLAEPLYSRSGPVGHSLHTVGAREI